MVENKIQKQISKRVAKPIVIIEKARAKIKVKYQSVRLRLITQNSA